jgi:hypothetical protein
MRASSIGFERHASPFGAGIPLKPKVYDSRATSASPARRTVRPDASCGLRADPAWARPPASRAASVRSTPVAPLSYVWLEAVVQASYPVVFSAGTISGGTEKLG